MNCWLQRPWIGTCASIFSRTTPESSKEASSSFIEEDGHISLDVNIHSMFYPDHAGLPHMIKAGGGAIVNTASQWGCTPLLGTSHTT